MTKTTRVASVLSLLLMGLALFIGGRNVQVQVLYTLLVLSPVVMGYIAQKIYGRDSVHGTFFWLMFLGIGLWVLGELLWFLFEWVFLIEPFPSIADVFYLAGYVPMFLGVYREISHVGLSYLKKNKTITGLLGVVFLMLSMLVVYFGIYGAYNQEAGFWINAISIGYGVGDLLLVWGSSLALGLLYEYKGGKITRIFSCLVIGFVFILLADLLFLQYHLEYSEGVRPYIYMDFLWVAGYLWFLVAYSYVIDLAKTIKLKIAKVVNNAR